MKMFKHYYFLSASLAAFALAFLVHAQQYDQSGFISLDCGLPRNSNYIEPTTLLNYISDAAFIETGTTHSVAAEYKADIQEQAKTLRSFPEGIRNCYTINVTARTRYLIRASFFHGNYDGLNTPPEFHLHMGGNFWTTVTIVNVSISTGTEIIHIPSQEYLHICLVNTDSGTPFISALELRPMTELVYYNTTGSVESLSLAARYDIGSIAGYRFPYDVIDRFWMPLLFGNWIQTSTSETVDANSTNKYRPPSVVTSTAGTPVNVGEPMQFNIPETDISTTYYYYMHFAEVRELEANESRAFNITINGKLEYHSLAPRYLRTTTIYNPFGLSGSTNYSFSLDRVENSTLPPILNAFELFSVVDFSQPETDVKDVDAISKIKSTYGVKKKNWDGDPCVPMDYLWTGVNCSYGSFDPPRITALNLSSSGLTGEITSHIAKLSMIQSLDLSNNNLTGSVPEFLSQLPNLRVLNLDRNNLTGSVPDELIKKANNGSLSLSFGENISLCSSSKCNTQTTEKKKSNNIIIPVVASVGGLGVLLLIVTAVLIGIKKKKRRESKSQNTSFQSSKRQFTYSEVRELTNDFKRTLGKGGFGTVYHGFIGDNTQVAVKILTSSSTQGYQQFQAEVSLLMKVYHGNLTSLVGYCNDGTNLALIYEFMPNGDLGSHLSGNRNRSVLSWEARLHIAVDAAQGLEYLHNGCKPPIIHRDIKPANILLTESFHAKLADFGLSRSFSPDVGSHVSTAVAGTPGYLDPSYSVTSRLNEKSDVYSFGVVLLVITTGRPAIFSNRDEPTERIHVSQWVGFMLGNGVITNVVDPGLQGDFETNSAWKMVDIGMACVSPVSANRPNMSEVVSVLKECLAAELARKNNSRVTDSTSDSLDVNSTAFSPMAR